MRRAFSALITTDIFPPVADVGVYRTVALCKHLVAGGWNVTVITARPRDDSCVDQAMLAALPGRVRVLRAPSPDLLRLAASLVKEKTIKGPQNVSPSASESRQKSLFHIVADWLSWWLHVPDTLTGWLVPAVRVGIRETRLHRPSVIYSTAPAWTSHVVGVALSILTRVPLVTDFQDPWCGSHWHKMPYQPQRWFDETLERLVVRQARQITCAWGGIRRHLARRYPQHANKMQTILNGFDPEDAEGVEPIRVGQSRCVLLHAGTFYGPRSPLPLLKALARLQGQAEQEARRLLVVLLGRPEYNGRPLADAAREYGVEQLVRIVPLVPRRKSLSMMKGADVLLLFGQSGCEALASVPAKAYDYISFGKPVLAIGAGTEVCGILRKGGCKVWSVKQDDVNGLEGALQNIGAEYEKGEFQMPMPSGQALRFAWDNRASQLMSVLEKVALGFKRPRWPCSGSPVGS